MPEGYRISHIFSLLNFDYITCHIKSIFYAENFHIIIIGKNIIGTKRNILQDLFISSTWIPKLKKFV